MFKWLKGIIIILITTPLLPLCIWYLICFLPYYDEIKASAIRGTETIAKIRYPIYALAVAGETKTGIQGYASRQAYRSFAYKKQPRDMLYWHVNNFLWYWLIPLHLNEHQIFGLWVDCALSNCGDGLNKVSQSYLGKTLIECSKNELAALVALIRNPGRFAPNTEAGQQRMKEIIAKSRFYNN